MTLLRFSLELNNLPELVIAATLSSLPDETARGPKQKAERAKQQYHLSPAAGLPFELLSAFASPAIWPAGIPVGQSPGFLNLHLQRFGDLVRSALAPGNPTHIGRITSHFGGDAVIHSAIK